MSDFCKMVGAGSLLSRRLQAVATSVALARPRETYRAHPLGQSGLGWFGSSGRWTSRSSGGWAVPGAAAAMQRCMCDKATPKIVDVEGGKISEKKPDEGKLYVAERAKNIVYAQEKFQISSYTRLPDGKDDMTAIFTDMTEPVRGVPIPDSIDGNILFQFNDLSQSHKMHMKNLSEIAYASAACGHIEPAPLLPVFTRIGLMPPVVKLVGNLVKVHETHEADMRQLLVDKKKNDGGSLWVLEVGQIMFQDLFNKTSPISVRDYRAAFVDKLSASQIDAIYLSNTKYLDDLPEFCRAFLGIPLEDAYMYSVDRAGFSILGLREGTDNMWQEYRFPFSREVTGLEDYETMLRSMVEEVRLAKEREASEGSGKDPTPTTAKQNAGTTPKKAAAGSPMGGMQEGMEELMQSEGFVEMMKKVQAESEAVAKKEQDEAEKENAKEEPGSKKE